MNVNDYNQKLNRVDIDKLLKPYEDSQPRHIPVSSNNPTIQRFPPLATAAGINPEFQEFYNNLVNYIFSKDIEGLYSISDKVLDFDNFKYNYSSCFNFIDQLFEYNQCQYSIDVEANMDRFQDIYRNILGGFNVMIVKTTIEPAEFDPGSMITHTTTANTELLFTYKDGFKLLSRFKPFKQEVI